MRYRSILTWRYILPLTWASVILALIFIGNGLYQEINIGSINWLTWQNVLPIALAAIVLLLILRPDNLNSCVSEGALRLTLTVEGDLVENKIISGRIMGKGADDYRAQGYKIILYAKTGFWYIESAEGAEIKLGDDCSWRKVSKYNEARMYAAFLVAGNYQWPPIIHKDHNTDLPPLPVDGDQIITWMLWSANSKPLSDAPEAKAIYWLTQQITPSDIVPNPLPQRTGMIISYEIPETSKAYPYLFSRSWIYDNALASIGFLLSDHLKEALMILSALIGQIKSNGKLNFWYNTHNAAHSEDFRSGTIAWIGYTLTFYQHKTNDAHVQAVAERIAGYLLSLQDMVSTSPSYGSIRTNSSDFLYETNHNIIAYFFLRDLGRLAENMVYTEHANLIRDSLLNHHWNETLHRFDQKIGDAKIGLIEVESLGALFSLAIGDIPRAQNCLNFVEKTYQPVEATGGRFGYAFYKDRSTIWSQGSLQMALAYKRIGNLKQADSIIKEIMRWQDVAGGVPYVMPEATLETGETYYEWSSVAGTAWLILALSDNEFFLGP